MKNGDRLGKILYALAWVLMSIAAALIVSSIYLAVKIYLKGKGWTEVMPSE